MKRVWKNEITPGLMDLSCGKVLYCGLDARGVPCVWVEHGADNRDRTLLAVGTDVPMPDTAEYRGTFVLAADGLVFHLYELEPDET